MAIAAAASGILLLMFLTAPYLAPYGTFYGLDGSPGLMDGGWKGHGFASMVYAFGDILCHQQTSRSFILNGSQMPVCIRDTGIIVGFFLMCFVCMILNRRIADNRFAVIGATLIVLMAIEWAVETTGFNSVPLRFLSGCLAGAGVVLLLNWQLFRNHEYDGI